MDEASVAKLTAAAAFSTNRLTPAVDDDTSTVHATDSEQSACVVPTSAVSVGKQRAGRRGLTTRKRLGLALQIDASEADGSKDSETRDSQSTASTGTTPGSDGSDAAALADAVPWWILEYKCPPPGHLGAHDVSVPVAKDDDGKQPAMSPLSSLIAATAADKDVATPAADHLQQRNVDDDASPTRVFAAGQPPGGVREIQKRRQPQHRDAIDYSPSQKRKMDSSAPSPAGVAKELKRFHERSETAAPGDASSVTPTALTPTAVTPSNLVRPLTKIDIHSERSTTSVAPTPVVAVVLDGTAKAATASTGHASSSA